ncbi:acyltransferase [Aurantiacibacter spongiae]|uniref:Acyltransferase n=1 Tax=Aurantiacibacter spongiae TaxID=2488860 RepID=A0A3N5CV94_9SPHN|nr:acyltransferase [Aurantiacibacter spongiae]RPF70549.1 acyltransferase [Aurantiacibacter spongiae]
MGGLSLRARTFLKEMGFADFTLRCLSFGVRVAALKLRLLWNNLRVLAWHKPAPFSTAFFGRMHFGLLPCRVEIGRDCGFGDGVTLAANDKAVIRIGDDTTINNGSIVVASDGVTIGNSVAIAEYVSIRDQEHGFSPGSGVRGQGYTTAPIVIGDCTWIGRGCYIAPGTVIGRDCIVGANSVVRGIFPDGVLIAGTPAKIRKRLTEATD